MCHRITGSGASFENDHGYRNNIVQHWGKHRDIKDMAEDLVETKESGKSMFTSIGNQPPAPKKGVSNVDFMVKELPDLIHSTGEFLLTNIINEMVIENLIFNMRHFLWIVLIIFPSLLM
jgi:hypothetical protein